VDSIEDGAIFEVGDYKVEGAANQPAGVWWETKFLADDGDSAFFPRPVFFVRGVEGIYINVVNCVSEVDARWLHGGNGSCSFVGETSLSFVFGSLTFRGG